MKPMKPFAQAKQFSSNQIIFGSILLLTLYSAVAVTVSLFRGSDAKIAYVNSAILLQKYKGAIDANKRFEEESKTWETNIRTLQSELDSLNFLFTKESEHWSLNKKKEVATYARKKEQDLNRYSQAIQQKASARQQELLTPVLTEINNAVSDYSKEKGYAMVLGTIEGNIVYADNAVDITEEVLTVLNR